MKDISGLDIVCFTIGVEILKKMLIMAKSLGGGGSEVALIEFINHIDLKKYEPTLLLIDKDNEYKYRLNEKVKIEYLNFDSKFYKSLVSMYQLPGKVIKKAKINSFFNIYSLVAKHVNFNLSSLYDIAIDFYGYGSFTTAFIAKNINAKKKVTWVHDSQIPWLENVKGYLKFYDQIFCVSNSVKKVFDKKYPMFSDKTKVMLNFVDFNRIKSNAQRHTKVFDNACLNIVTVGRLNEAKGIDIAIKAANYLNKRALNFKWYIVGDGKEFHKLNRLIKKYELGNRFILLGYKSNPYLYMSECDLYVQPSRHEGFGLTVLEALFLKKVVLASNIPAFKEQIKNNVNGFLFNLDSQDLGETIMNVYNNKQMMDKVTNNNIHEWNKKMKTYNNQMSIIDSLIGESK